MTAVATRRRGAGGQYSSTSTLRATDERILRYDEQKNWCEKTDTLQIARLQRSKELEEK